MTERSCDKYNIVFFDGVRNLCNDFIVFLIKRDKNKHLRFSSLQSDFAQKFHAGRGISITNLNTIYFYINGMLYKRHKAVFNILNYLNVYYRVLSILRYIPIFIGYPAYNFVAKRRYHVWGKKSSCRMASPEEKKKFLEVY
jgi:predicted DCC family thiol-disulfide oxidoreductase YuxK